MSDEMAVEVLEYPGRGVKRTQPLLYNINDLVDYAFQHTVKVIENSPYIIYGHSMGALIGYLVCKKIESQLINRPMRLIVSGSNPPSKMGKENISGLSSKAFWDKIYDYGGLPNEILEDKDVKTFFEPILRADFECIEKYQYDETSKKKLTIPIDVFYGSEEDINNEEIVLWQKETTEKANITKLDGNHFFIFHHQEFFRNYFKTLISKTYV